MEEKVNNGTQNMPEPQVLSYNSFFRVTPVFMNDIQFVLGDMAYADVRKVLDIITARNGVLPSAVLNELIRTIAGMPYKYVYNIMNVIGQKDKFVKYFVEIDENGNPVQKDSSIGAVENN